MNFYGGQNLANSWRTVRGNTIQIAEEIPADQYSYRGTADTMSIGEMLAHMAMSTYWAMQAHFVDKKDVLTGEQFGAYFGASQKIGATLTTKEAIVAALRTYGDEVATALAGASDATLAEVVTIPAGAKTRFEMLLGLKEHEMHHRGQLMHMQRHIGLVPHLTRERLARSAPPAAAATAGSAA